MPCVGLLDDGRYKAGPGVQRDVAFGPVLDHALPSIDGPDRVDDVPGCAEALFDKAADELGQPVRVRRGDDNRADLVGHGCPPCCLSSSITFVASSSARPIAPQPVTILPS